MKTLSGVGEYTDIIYKHPMTILTTGLSHLYQVYHLHWAVTFCALWGNYLLFLSSSESNSQDLLGTKSEKNPCQPLHRDFPLGSISGLKLIWKMNVLQSGTAYREANVGNQLCGWYSESAFLKDNRREKWENMQETDWVEWALIILRTAPQLHLPRHLFEDGEVGRWEIQVTDEVFRGLNALS